MLAGGELSFDEQAARTRQSVSMSADKLQVLVFIILFYAGIVFVLVFRLFGCLVGWLVLCRCVCLWVWLCRRFVVVLWWWLVVVGVWACLWLFR